MHVIQNEILPNSRHNIIDQINISVRIYVKPLLLDAYRKKLSYSCHYLILPSLRLFLLSYIFFSLIEYPDFDNDPFSFSFDSIPKN